MLRVKSLQVFFSGKKTLLYDFHIASKAKMVEFAGTSFLTQDIACLSNIPSA